MNIIAVTTPTVYLIAGSVDDFGPARAVDLEAGTVGPVQPLGQILKQGYWEAFEDITGEATVMINQVLNHNGLALLPAVVGAVRNV